MLMFFLRKIRSLEAQVERLRSRLITEGNIKVSLYKENENLRAKCNTLQRENKLLSDEIVEHKKKYADEVQKRLALVYQVCQSERRSAE